MKRWVQESKITTVPCLVRDTGFTQEERERFVRVKITLKVFQENKKVASVWRSFGLI